MEAGKLITLCMIVKDEAMWVEKCLNSVKGLVSQVVVVDTGSSDDTVKIAQSLGAEVCRFDWNEDTAAARNEGLKRATGDWILVLDADETLSPADFDRIRLLTQLPEYDGFALVQRNYTNDTYREDFVFAVGDDYEESVGFAGWVPRLIVRLFRNKPEIRFEGIAHEIVEGSITKSGGKYFAADVPVHHFKELKPAAVLAEKVGHYRRMGMRKLNAEPFNPRAWLEMGTVEREAGDFEKAKFYFDGAIEVDQNMVEAWQGLGVCLGKLGDDDGAIAAFRKAIGISPAYPTPYFSLGVAYYRKGQLNDAKDALVEGLRIKPEDYNALSNLGAILEQGGYPEKAVEILQHVVGIDTQNSRAHYNLGVALEKLGRGSEAADAYLKAAGLGYHNSEEALKRARILKKG